MSRSKLGTNLTENQTIKARDCSPWTIKYKTISCRYQQADGGYGRFTRGARLYGQPRDFRRAENQFLNERGFARTINGEYRATRGGATSYTFGEAYRMNDFRDSPRERRGSVSS